MKKIFLFIIKICMVLFVLLVIIESNWRKWLYGDVCKPQNSKIHLEKNENSNNFNVNVSIEIPQRGIVYTFLRNEYFILIGVLNLTTNEYFYPTFIGSAAREELLIFNGGQKFSLSIDGIFEQNKDGQYSLSIDRFYPIMIPAGKYRIFASLIFYDHPSLINSEFSTYPPKEANNLIVDLP